MRCSSLLSVLSRALTLCSLLALVSCGGSEDSDSTAAVTASYDSLWTNLFEGRCANCHAAGRDSGTAGGPDLSTKDGFYTAFFNVKGSAYTAWTTFNNNRQDCLQKSFIAPGSSAQSLVVGVLDSANAPCTVKAHDEPPQSIPVSAATLTALKQWIDAGATR